MITLSSLKYYTTTEEQKSLEESLAAIQNIQLPTVVSSDISETMSADHFNTVQRTLIAALTVLYKEADNVENIIKNISSRNDSEFVKLTTKLHDIQARINKLEYYKQHADNTSIRVDLTNGSKEPALYGTSDGYSLDNFSITTERVLNINHTSASGVPLATVSVVNRFGIPLEDVISNDITNILKYDASKVWEETILSPSRIVADADAISWLSGLDYTCGAAARICVEFENVVNVTTLEIDEIAPFPLTFLSVSVVDENGTEVQAWANGDPLIQNGTQTQLPLFNTNSPRTVGVTGRIFYITLVQENYRHIIYSYTPSQESDIKYWKASQNNNTAYASIQTEDDNTFWDTSAVGITPETVAELKRWSDWAEATKKLLTTTQQKAIDEIAKRYGTIAALLAQLSSTATVTTQADIRFEYKYGIRSLALLHQEFLTEGKFVSNVLDIEGELRQARINAEVFPSSGTDVAETVIWTAEDVGFTAGELVDGYIDYTEIQNHTDDLVNTAAHVTTWLALTDDGNPPMVPVFPDTWTRITPQSDTPLYDELGATAIGTSSGQPLLGYNDGSLLIYSPGTGLVSFGTSPHSTKVTYISSQQSVLYVAWEEDNENSNLYMYIESSTPSWEFVSTIKTGTKVEIVDTSTIVYFVLNGFGQTDLERATYGGTFTTDTLSTPGELDADGNIITPSDFAENSAGRFIAIGAKIFRFVPLDGDYGYWQLIYTNTEETINKIAIVTDSDITTCIATLSNGDVVSISGGDVDDDYYIDATFGSKGISTLSSINRPIDVDVDVNGAIYVVDGPTGRIIKLDQAGNIMLWWGGIGSDDNSLNFRNEYGLDSSGGIATYDSSGRVFVYITDYANDRVQIFDEYGTYIASINSITGAYGIDISSDGIILISGYDRLYVYEHHDSGAAIQRAILTEVTNGVPSSVRYGSVAISDVAASIYMSVENKIYVWERDGITWDFSSSPSDTTIAKPSGGQTPNVIGCSLNNDASTLYIADQLNKKIYIYTASTMALASTIGSAGTGDGEFYGIMSIEFSDDMLYVGDYRRIQKVDTTGQFVTDYTSNSSDAGQKKLHQPTAVASDSTGIYVADNNNKRVEKFDLTGEFVWSYGVYGTGAGELDYVRFIETDGTNLFVCDWGNLYSLDPTTGVLLASRSLDDIGVYLYTGMSTRGLTISDTGLPCLLWQDYSITSWGVREYSLDLTTYTDIVTFSGGSYVYDCKGITGVDTDVNGLRYFYLLAEATNSESTPVHSDVVREYYQVGSTPAWTYSTLYEETIVSDSTITDFEITDNGLIVLLNETSGEPVEDTIIVYDYNEDTTATITSGTVEGIDGTITNAQGFSVSDNSLYIADTDNNRIVRVLFPYSTDRWSTETIGIGTGDEDTEFLHIGGTEGARNVYVANTIDTSSVLSVYTYDTSFWYKQNIVAPLGGVDLACYYGTEYIIRTGLGYVTKLSSLFHWTWLFEEAGLNTLTVADITEEFSTTSEDGKIVLSEYPFIDVDAINTFHVRHYPGVVYNPNNESHPVVKPMIIEITDAYGNVIKADTTGEPYKYTGRPTFQTIPATINTTTGTTVEEQHNTVLSIISKYILSQTTLLDQNILTKYSSELGNYGIDVTNTAASTLSKTISRRVFQSQYKAWANDPGFKIGIVTTDATGALRVYYNDSQSYSVTNLPAAHIFPADGVVVFTEAIPETLILRETTQSGTITRNVTITNDDLVVVSFDFYAPSGLVPKKNLDGSLYRDTNGNVVFEEKQTRTTPYTTNMTDYLGGIMPDLSQIPFSQSGSPSDSNYYPVIAYVQRGKELLLNRAITEEDGATITVKYRSMKLRPRLIVDMNRATTEDSLPIEQSPRVVQCDILVGRVSL